MNTFSIKEAVKFGWNTVFKNFWYLVGVCVVANWVPQIISNGGQQMQKTGAGIIGTIIVIAGSLISILLTLNAIKIYIGIVDSNKLPFKSLVEYDARMWRYLGASILYGLIVLGGTLLLIVPGIIWSIKYSFFAYGIVDKNLKIKESLRHSANITNGQKWNLFGFILVIIGVNILGALALFVGLLVTIPLTMIAFAYVYRKISREAEQLMAVDKTVVSA